MITIARFSLAIEAHIARAKLESEGIPAFVADEHTITANWLYSNAMGGVRLQVPNACAEHAHAILATDFTEDLIAEQGHDALTCTHCGSSDIQVFTKGKQFAFAMFLLIDFPLWPFWRVAQCLACKKAVRYRL